MKPEAIQIFSGVAEHAKWSPNGRFIVFDSDTGNSIKIIPAEGGEPINFLPDTIQVQNGGCPAGHPMLHKLHLKILNTHCVFII